MNLITLLEFLIVLCNYEIFRESTSRLKISSEKWIDYARIAFSVDPRIALSLAARFPTNSTLKSELTQLVQVC